MQQIVAYNLYVTQAIEFESSRDINQLSYFPSQNLFSVYLKSPCKTL